MNRAGVKVAVVLVGALVGLGAATSAAGGDDDDRLEASLTGYEEVPAISSDGDGSFRAQVSSDEDEIHYRLRYEDLPTTVAQAHIHVGQLSVNGGISAFLCSNLPAPPPGTPACPQEGKVTGTITAEDVIGPSGQGVAPGELDELLAAIDAGVAYVNVHTEAFPGGEIRGQLED